MKLRKMLGRSGPQNKVDGVFRLFMKKRLASKAKKDFFMATNDCQCGNSISDYFKNVFVKELSYRLAEIDIDIGIKIWKRINEDDPTGGDGPFHFVTSHHIQTPLQTNTSRSDNIYAATEDEALIKAVSTFDAFYKCAVEQGLQPDPSWLILNTRY